MVARWASTELSTALRISAISPADFTPRMATVGRLYGAHPWYRDILGALAFDYPDRVVGLQCADLLSHQMRWDVEKEYANAPLSLENVGPTKALEWATGGKPIRGHEFDRKGLLRTIRRFHGLGCPSGPADLFSSSPA